MLQKIRTGKAKFAESKVNLLNWTVFPVTWLQLNERSWRYQAW